jgi:dolichol-phosphate mannosyltransferase
VKFDDTALGWSLVFILVLFFAMLLDVPVEHRVFASGLADHLLHHEKWLLWLARRPGSFLTFTLPAAALLAIEPQQSLDSKRSLESVRIADPARIRAALIVLLAGLYSGANWIIKWAVGRTRPYHDPATAPFQLHPMEHGVLGLFHATRPYSFPSGDVCLAAATALALCWALPRGWGVWWGLVVLVAIERMAEMAHFPSDVVAGAGAGVLAALAARATVNHCEIVIHSNSVKPRVERNAAGAVFNGGAAPGAGSVSPTRGVFKRDSFMSQSVYLSLVIPAFNEQQVVPALLERVEKALVQTGQSFEVVMVDDGSSDATPQMLIDAMATRPWLRLLRMARNAGQSAAFDAGFKAARGEVIATIDADLQNDPEEIPRLLPMLEGWDMINGWRKDRHDSKFRLVQTKIANGIRNWLSDETINDSACSLKLYKRHCVEGIQLYTGMHRFMPTLVKMRGYTCTEVPVKHSARFAGVSKYGFRNRALRALLDLLAVRWMKKRYLRYSASEVSRPGEQFATSNEVFSSTNSVNPALNGAPTASVSA